MKNSRWIEFVTCTLIPFLIPMINDIIPKEHISELAVTIISFIILGIDAFFIVRFYVRTNKDKQGQTRTNKNSLPLKLIVLHILMHFNLVREKEIIL